MATRAKQDRKPNILVIWGDDVGIWNISAYHRGMTGESTPNIDRIARKGCCCRSLGQASCTAGTGLRSSPGAGTCRLLGGSEEDRSRGMASGAADAGPRNRSRDRIGRLGSLGGDAVGRLKMWCTPAVGGATASLHRRAIVDRRACRCLDFQH